MEVGNGTPKGAIEILQAVNKKSSLAWRESTNTLKELYGRNIDVAIGFH